MFNDTTLLTLVPKNGTVEDRLDAYLAFSAYITELYR